MTQTAKKNLVKNLDKIYFTEMEDPPTHISTLRSDTGFKNDVLPRESGGR
jgi:hypothetical protein